jgi:pimeloyl-ACP methyl ester carboxylesterase
VSVAPVELAVRLPQEAGTGIPLVLLHAFPLDSTMWDQVVPRLAGVGRVILVDLPGLGASPLPAAGEPSLDVSADAVVAALDRLRVGRAVFAGVSMGGYVAMAVARRHPQRIAGLALIDTRSGADGDQARENRFRMAEAVLGETGTRALAPMLDTLLGPSTHARRPELVAALAERLRSAPAAGVAWSQRAMAVRPDSTAVLAALAVPSAVVVGAQDVLATPASAQELAAALPDSVLTVLPDAGHLTPLEAPAALADAVIDLVVRTRP